MKSLLLAAVAALMLGACATGPSLPESQRMQIYRDNAGAPVNNFHYFGSLHSWEPVGDAALVVWTRPSDGYLLTLAASCPQLDFARAISLSDQSGSVFAGLDSVTVLGQGTNIPCRIEQIQPLDIDAARRAEDAAEAELQASGGT